MAFKTPIFAEQAATIAELERTIHEARQLAMDGRFDEHLASLMERGQGLLDQVEAAVAALPIPSRRDALDALSTLRSSFSALGRMVAAKGNDDTSQKE